MAESDYKPRHGAKFARAIAGPKKRTSKSKKGGKGKGKGNSWLKYVEGR